MRLGPNVLVGLVSSAWTTVLGLAVLPLYLRYLGIEAYGLIGFFVTMQAILQILDFGLAPTMNREVARSAGSGDVRAAGRLLHTLGFVSWGTALLIAVALWVVAPVVARGWLQPRQLPPETVAQAVAMTGVVVACRWPVGLYLGVLMGAERLGVVSALGIVTATVSNLGAVAVLAFVSPTLQAFFLWQATAGLLHALAARWAAWGAVGRTPGFRFDASELRRVWRFSAGMSAIAVFGLAFSQLDKLLLSRLLGLEEFGRYMLATAVASGLYVLVTPVYNAIFPRFSSLVASGQTDGISSLYRRGGALLGSVLLPVALLLFLSGEDLIRVWTGDAGLAAAVAPIVALLAAGSALHGVMHMQYALQLSHGLTSVPLKLYTVLMLVQVPLLVALALSFGALGGAAAWLALQVLYVTIGTAMTHRHLLRGIGMNWLRSSLGVPLGISIVAGVVGHAMLHGTAWPTAARVTLGFALAVSAAAASLAVDPGVRTMIREGIGIGRARPGRNGRPTHV